MFKYTLAALIAGATANADVYDKFAEGSESRDL